LPFRGWPRQFTCRVEDAPHGGVATCPLGKPQEVSLPAEVLTKAGGPDNWLVGVRSTRGITLRFVIPAQAGIHGGWPRRLACRGAQHKRNSLTVYHSPRIVARDKLQRESLSPDVIPVKKGIQKLFGWDE